MTAPPAATAYSQAFDAALDALDSYLEQIGLDLDWLTAPTSVAAAIAQHYGDDQLGERVAELEQVTAQWERASC